MRPRRLIGSVAAAVRATLAGAVAVGSLTVAGRTTSAGFTSSIIGSNTLPAYNFPDANNGMYHDSAADYIRFASGGAFTFGASGGTFVVIGATQFYSTVSVDGDLTMEAGRALAIDSGTVADCGLQFRGNPDTGLYQDGTDRLAAAAAGADRMYWGGGITNVYGLIIAPNIQANYLSLPESTAPTPVANQAILYARDTGTKTESAIMHGAGGTIVVQGIEI